MMRNGASTPTIKGSRHTKLLLFCTLPLLSWGYAQSTVTSYQCGIGFHPIDLTFTADGSLYSTQFTAQQRRSAAPNDLFLKSSEAERSLFSTQSGTCERIADAPEASFGLTTTFDNRVCVSHYLFDGGRESALSCYDTQAWHLEYRSFVDQIGDLAATSKGFWVGGQAFSLTETSQGDLVLLLPEEVKRPIANNDQIGATTFLAIGSSGELFAAGVTIDYLDGNRVSGCCVWKVAENGVMELLAQGFMLPTGVLEVSGSLWVADYFLGNLQEISLDTGKLKTVFRGLQGPMGLAQAPHGDICVAEMTASRIRCFPLEVLRQQ